MNYNIDKDGYYGEFGGAYIPEMLYPNVEELRNNYIKNSFDKIYYFLTNFIYIFIFSINNNGIFWYL